jgi:hypothetical protein
VMQLLDECAEVLPYLPSTAKVPCPRPSLLLPERCAIAVRVAAWL